MGTFREHHFYFGWFWRPEVKTPFEILAVYTLTYEVRRIVDNMCDNMCVLVCKNQLGGYQACEELTDMWRPKSAPDSPVT